MRAIHVGTLHEKVSKLIGRGLNPGYTHARIDPQVLLSLSNGHRKQRLYGPPLQRISAKTPYGYPEDMPLAKSRTQIYYN